MIYQRGDKWAGHVYDSRTGKRLWIGTHPTKRAAQKAEMATYDRIQSGEDMASTVSAFAALWTEMDGPYARKAASTNKNNAERLRGFVRDYGHRKLSSFTKHEARLWAHTAGWQYPAVRAMFSDARRDGLIADNVFLGCGKPPGRRERIPRSLEVLQIARYAGEVHGHWGARVFGPLILFRAYTGLRCGEAYAMELYPTDSANYVDWEHPGGPAVIVNWAWNQSTGRMEPPKYESSRRVALLPQAARAVPGQSYAGSPLMFPAVMGGRLSGRNLSTYWRPIREGLKLPFDFYSLRHHYGTLLAERSINPSAIAKAMGHKDEGRTALERYVRYSEQTAMDQIRAAFEEPEADSSHVPDAG